MADQHPKEMNIDYQQLKQGRLPDKQHPNVPSIRTASRVFSLGLEQGLMDTMWYKEERDMKQKGKGKGGKGPKVKGKFKARRKW